MPGFALGLFAAVIGFIVGSFSWRGKEVRGLRENKDKWEEMYYEAKANADKYEGMYLELQAEQDAQCKAAKK